MVIPVIGKLVMEVDFSKLKYVLQHEVREGDKVISPEVAIQVGNFITQSIDLLIVAFALFLVVKTMNRIKKKEEAKPVLSKEEVLLSEIRDILREKK